MIRNQSVVYLGAKKVCYFLLGGVRVFNSVVEKGGLNHDKVMDVSFFCEDVGDTCAIDEEVIR